MSTREVLKDVVDALNRGVTAVALALLLGAAWVPILWDYSELQPVGTGIVVETLDGSDPVVRLQSGEHVSVEGLDAEVGSSVEIQDAPLLTPGVHEETIDHWFIPFLLGAFGIAATAGVLMFVGGMILERVDQMLWQGTRSRDYTEW